MEINDTVKQVEPEKFTDAQIILQYIFGGKSTFTLQSIASGERFTYQIVQSAKRPGDSRPPVFFVTVLTGPDNSDNYSFVGTIFERKTYKFSPRAGFTLQSPSVRAWQWAFTNFVSGIVPDKLEFWPSAHCARCGKKLTVPASVHDGFGPDCITKVGGLGNGKTPIVGNQQAISANPQAKSAFDQATALVQASGRAMRSQNPNESPKEEVESIGRMVAAKRKSDPEGFMMDGEISDPLEAEKFWFKRYQKSPMSATELAELEAQ